jgi:hypothetical protein
MLIGPCEGPFFTKLVGCADVDNALRRLDKVTKEEALTVAAQALDAAHRVDGLVMTIASEVEGVESRIQRLEGRINPYRDVLDSTRPYSTSRKYNLNKSRRSDRTDRHRPYQCGLYAIPHDPITGSNCLNF